MIRSKIFKYFGLAAALLCAGALPAVHAQDYPNRPVRLIVPFPPGGTTDAIARVFAQYLQEKIGQAVVVDNRGGAGSQIGVEAGAKATPDGYTLLFGPADGLALLPVVKKKVPYDPIKDFTPIAFVARSPLAYAVNPNVPAKTLPEFIALAKSKPGALRFGSAGYGSILHLGMELLRVHAHIDILHVPYKGGGPALNDLLAGQIDIMSAGPVGIAKQAQAGRLRVLAQTGPTRHPLLPAIPTTKELGMPEMAVVSWFGLLGPAGLPQPIVDHMGKATAEVLDNPIVKERFINVGCEAEKMSAGEFGQFIAAENRKWAGVVKAAGLQLQD